MTLWLDLDGIDLAVTGEIVKGYLAMFDRFEVRGVRVRSPAQNIKELLTEGFSKRLTAAALSEAQHPHPIPFPYDVPTRGPLSDGFTVEPAGPDPRLERAAPSGGEYPSREAVEAEGGTS